MRPVKTKSSSHSPAFSPHNPYIVGSSYDRQARTMTVYGTPTRRKPLKKVPSALTTRRLVLSAMGIRPRA